jgi:hypothetical protein
VIILLAKTFTNLGSSTVEALRSFVRDVECDDLTTSQKYVKLHRLFIQYWNSRRKIFLRGVISEVSVGAVAISVLAIGLEILWFKQGRGRWIFRVIIRSTPSFGGDVKPSAPYLKILSHVKES